MDDKMKQLLWLTLLLLLTSCGGGDKSDDTTKHSKLLAPSGNQIYLGAFPDFGGPEDQVSTQKIKVFESLIGKKIVWAYFSQNWFKGMVYPKKHIHAITDSGAIPFVRFMPRSDEVQNKPEVKFSLQHIIDGRFDSELKAWAKEAIADDIPLLVDFAVEPNGNWFGWSGAFNGASTTDAYGKNDYPDGPERYRDAYRHIITLFKAEGVRHLTWFFHFNWVSYPDEAWNKPHYYYPGDDYIDWIGASLYGAQTLSEEWEGLEFSTLLESHAEDAKAVTTKKPMALLEFGVTDHHPEGDKSLWLEDAFDTILSNDYITFNAISPWHENWENEDGTFSTIRLDSSDKALKMFKEKVSDTRFISEGVFGEEGA